jgi:hypothetical protein
MFLLCNNVFSGNLRLEHVKSSVALNPFFPVFGRRRMMWKKATIELLKKKGAVQECHRRTSCGISSLPSPQFCEVVLFKSSLVLILIRASSRDDPVL